MEPARRKRPPTCHFDVASLVDGWKKLASLKSCGFAWDGSDYPNDRRGRVACIPSLIRHKEALGVLVHIAPSGFPSWSRLRQALESLAREFKIFDGQDAFRLSMLAADRWRIMAKDIYNLARSGYAEETNILPVVKKIQLDFPDTAGEPAPTALVAATSSSSGEANAQALQDLFPSLEGLDDGASDPGQVSDDDTLEFVEMVSWVCKCAECLASEAAAAAAVDDVIAVSDGENDVMIVPDAGRGGQKRETKGLDDENTPQPKRRMISGKRAAPEYDTPPEVGAKRGPKRGAKRGPKRGPKRGSKPRVAVHRASARLRLSRDVAPPVKKVTRKAKANRPGEVYLLDVGGKYIIGQTSRNSASYATNIARVLTAIEEKTCTTTGQARELLRGMTPTGIVE